MILALRDMRVRVTSLRSLSSLSSFMTRWCLRDGAGLSAGVRCSAQILRIVERFRAQKVNSAEGIRRNFCRFHRKRKTGGLKPPALTQRMIN
jgi:hypothetical protein